MTPDPEKVFENVVTQIFNPLYQLAIGVALIYFFYGVFKFIVDLNNPDEKNTGKAHLLYGTIGLFILLSIGGIMRVFNDLFGGMFSF